MENYNKIELIYKSCTVGASIKEKREGERIEREGICEALRAVPTGCAVCFLLCSCRLVVILVLLCLVFLLFVFCILNIISVW